MRFRAKINVDNFWYLSNYNDVRLSKLNPKIHFKNYGMSEGRIPNPFFMVRSTFFKNLFFLLSVFGIRLYESETLSHSKFRVFYKMVINIFFWKEYGFLKNISNIAPKIYLTSWVGGGVSDALEIYIRKDLKKFDTVIVLRSLKGISIQSAPVLKVEMHSKDTEHPNIHLCPFPTIFLTKLFANSSNVAEIDVHHVFGFEKFLDFILSNFVTKLNFYVHDYYLFSENWSFYKTDILLTGDKTSYFQTQINNVWPISSRKLFLSKCYSIIATSHHTFKLLYNEKDFPVDKLEFEYIPEESNLEFNQLDSIVELSREGKKRKKRIKILILGNLGIYKGLTLLNNIVDKLKSDDFEFNIFHIGNVTEGVLSSEIVSYGWLEKNQREVEIERLNSDLALLPAQSPETYSLILSELIRLKIPIVASKIGAISERIFDRWNAHLVSDYMSSESWAIEIIDFCKNNFQDGHIGSDFSAEEIELIFEKRIRS